MKAASKARKKRPPTKWKVTPKRPLRIGGTVIRSSSVTTLTIDSRETVRRIRASDIDSDPDGGLS